MNKKLKLWELNRVSEEKFKSQQKFPIILVLDSIRSLNNIGTFFRTGDAFNVEKIYLCGITACPPHRDINKTALGATETVAWEHRESLCDLIRELKDQNIQVAAVEQSEETVMLHQIKDYSDKRTALIFGNEVDGVEQEAIDLSDFVVEIPQFGTKHSLNVSVCAGVVVWEFVQAHLPK